jgi:hypothetical protein
MTTRHHPATPHPRAGAAVLAPALAAALGALVAAGAGAHEGHDHDAAPGAVARVEGGPRFAATAGPFELVGALDGRRLVLWLDRADDTAPIVGASIDLDVGGRAHAAAPEGDVYVVRLDAAPAPGTLPIVATVVAGGDADVLAAELRIEAPAPPSAGGTAQAATMPGDTARIVAVGAIAALVAGSVGWLAGRRGRAAGRG